MIKSYLLVGLRNLLKNKSYVIINTFGLGIALACCITAYLIVAYNVEFDDFHSDDKVKNIYKVHSQFTRTEGDPYIQNSAPINFAPNAIKDFSGIKKFTRYNREGGSIKYGDDIFSESVAFADSTFFEMFDFPLLHGSHEAFKNLESIYISEKMVEKYFKEEDPIGQILTLNFRNQTEIKAVVRGVLKKVPVNNSFNFNFLIREEHFMDIYNLDSDNWKDWRDSSTFFELTSSEQAPILSQQFNQYLERRNKEKPDRTVNSYELHQFKSNFNQDDINWSPANLRISMLPLVVFVSMAMMILLIACFNMTNTSIALTARRLKEVGIRKVVGAAKWQVVTQFLLETLVVIVLALIAGLAIAQILVPAFLTMWDLGYTMEDLSGINLVFTLLSLVFFTSILGGIYPAIFNSKFKPIVLLKGNVKVKGTNMLTRSLLTVQFALSVIVLIAGISFVQNTEYQEGINLGYDKNEVLLIPIQGEKTYSVLKNEVKSNPKVELVGVSNHSFGWGKYSIAVEVDTAKYEAVHYGVGENYHEVMGVNIIQGRTLNLDNMTDVEGSVVVNQAFLDKVNMDDPINRIIKVHEVKRKIVGVVSNHIDNLFSSKEEEACVFYPAKKDEYSVMLIKADSNDLLDIKESTEAIWKKHFPDETYDARLQSDIVLGGVRETNTNLKKIFIFLTILGGLLSASGIFALASLNVEKRSKEIGIRKALGASVQNIMGLMNREFVIILTLAGILGSLGGYFITSALLDSIYSFHIVVGWIPALICATLIFVVGISTTSVTILQAARANPVDTLRDE
jgi:putative ABC transport system permease protein